MDQRRLEVERELDKGFQEIKIKIFDDVEAALKNYEDNTKEYEGLVGHSQDRGGGQV